MSAASQRALAHEIKRLGLNPKKNYTAEQLRHYQHLSRVGQWPPKAAHPVVAPTQHQEVVKPVAKPPEAPKAEAQVEPVPQVKEPEGVKQEVIAEVADADKPKKKGSKKDKDPSSPDGSSTPES